MTLPAGPRSSSYRQRGRATWRRRNARCTAQQRGDEAAQDGGPADGVLLGVEAAVDKDLGDASSGEDEEEEDEEKEE